MSNQQADMRQHEQEMREAFERSIDERLGQNCSPNYEYDWELWQDAWQAATLAAEARIRELEAKANRYWYIKEQMWHNHDNSIWDEPVQHLDAAIDAALTEHKENQR